MKIEAYGQEAVICAVGLADEPDENGTFTAEFYPVDLLLALRTSNRVLEGHPFLDLKPEDGDKPTVAIEQLRPRQVQKIRREAGRGKMVALKVRHDRPPRSGRGRQWRRAQSGQLHKERRERFGFFFVKGTDYLSEEDIHWISAICEDGKLYLERLQAVQAMGKFVIRLRQVVERSRPKRQVGKKKKLKRKDRRRQKVLV